MTNYNVTVTRGGDHRCNGCYETFTERGIKAHQNHRYAHGGCRPMDTPARTWSSPPLTATVEFVAVSAGNTITVGMHTHLDAEVPGPMRRFVTTVATVTPEGMYAVLLDDADRTKALAARGWTVDTLNGWTNGVAIVTPTPNP